MEVTPTLFFPLSGEQLQSAIQNPDAPTELNFVGIEAVIDGIPEQGTPRVTTNIRFAHTPAPYALVEGGWLPMPFVTTQHFLVDRNVVSTLRSIRSRGARTDELSFAWWTKLFEGGSGTLNPLLYAYEGRHRRTPTTEEFVQQYLEGVSELIQAFPAATVIQHHQEHFDIAYAQLTALTARGEIDTTFLLAAVPLISDRVPRSRERKIQDQIIALAARHGVVRGAPVVL